MSTLFKAARQYQTRPADETFATIEDAYNVARAYAKNTVEKQDIHPATIRAEAITTDDGGGDLVLVGKGKNPAKLTHWAFGQLAQRAALTDVSDATGRATVSAAKYLRALPPALAAENINYGLQQRYNEESEERINLLVQANGELVIRALTSDRYARIWNYEVLQRMRDFQQYGWTNPRPFRGKNGEEQHPTIYVSDHDLFVFQCNEDKRVIVPGKPDGLSRGFFVENCEVGKATFRVTAFLFDYMCSNHMIWGASQVSEISVKHIGTARDRMNAAMQEFVIQLNRWAESSTDEDRNKIEAARRFKIAATKDEVLDKIFARLRGAATRTALEHGYDTAALHSTEDGDPNTAWGLAAGLTRYSQTLPYADARVSVDRAAAKIVQLAF